MAVPKIFVSYRRRDSAATSGRLRDHMAARLGSERVFLDVDKIAIGEDFVTAIETEIRRCKVMLVIIGRDWSDPAGSGARLHEDGDHVRAEIRAGLNSGRSESLSAAAMLDPSSGERSARTCVFTASLSMRTVTESELALPSLRGD